MKRLFYFFLMALMMVPATVSCKKERNPKAKVPVPEAVDLGLSVKWASFNLGASQPSELGEYFAWGETKTKYYDGYQSNTYQWIKDDKLTKYCPKEDNGYEGYNDNRVKLESEDDVAQKLLGGKWRMPTRAECEELKNLCLWEFDTVDGLDGVRIYSKDKSTSIFLPATGTLGYNKPTTSQTYGYYWASTFSLMMPYNGDCIGFTAGTPVNPNVGILVRYAGLPIRPVYGK